MEPAGNVGHAGDPSDNPAVNERSERLAELERGFGRVDVPGLGGEMLDRLRQDARAGRQDQVVVAESFAIGEVSGPG